MKITKRILVAMLALALLVAGFAFMASAEEENPFSTDGIDEIEDILEFYDYEIYVNNDLNFYDDEAAAPVEETEDEVEAVVQIPGDASAGYQVILPEPESNVIFEFSVYVGEDAVGNLSFDLKARLMKGELPDSHFTTLFQIDMLANTPSFKYSLWNADEEVFEADTVALKGITPAVETWYDVVLVFDADNACYSFSVTPEGGEKVDSPAISLGDKVAMDYFRLVGEFRNYTPEAIGNSASFKTRDVEIYGGTFVRDIDKRDEITATTLLELADIYEAARADGDADTCIRIAEVYKALDHNDSFEGVLEDTESVYNYAYAQALIVSTGAIDETDTYANRRAVVAGIDRYNSFVPTDEALFDSEGAYVETAGIDATLAASVKAARVLLEKERATLNAIQENSIEFVKILLGEAVETTEEGEPVSIPAYNDEWVNFDGEILPYYNRLKALFATKSEQPDLTYADETVDMADVVEAWEKLENKVSFAQESKDTFKSYVDILNKTSKKFGVRYYDGYLPAKAFFEELVDNEYFDVDTYAELGKVIKTYNTNAAKMVIDETNCREFIKIVSEASLATYYTALVERLDKAATYLDKIEGKEDYKGIPEAKATYNTLLEATLKDKGNADVYIAKVNAAVEIFESDTATFAEKQAAFSAATALKALGNVYGYAGVSEANVALSQVESALAFVEGNSITLIDLVSQLADATTLTERRAIIRLAKEAAANSEATYEGVAAAKAKLEEAVTAFNKVVETANTALADATVNGASVAAALSGDASIYKTASIIQDYAK